MLEIAEAGVYCGVWCEANLAELEDTLLYRFDQAGRDPQECRSAIQRFRRQMVTAFPDAVVTGWESIEDAYELPDPDDRRTWAREVEVVLAELPTQQAGALRLAGVSGHTVGRVDVHRAVGRRR